MSEDWRTIRDKAKKAGKRARLTAKEKEERVDAIAKFGVAGAASRLGMSTQALWMWWRDYQRQEMVKTHLGGISPRQLELILKAYGLLKEAFGDEE